MLIHTGIHRHKDHMPHTFTVYTVSDEQRQSGGGLDGLGGLGMPTHFVQGGLVSDTGRIQGFHLAPLGLQRVKEQIIIWNKASSAYYVADPPMRT